MQLLCRHDWPGNVRELENAIERAVVLSGGRSLGVDDFAFVQSAAMRASRPGSLLEMENIHIRQIMEECDWNITRAAHVLGINRVTLHKKIKRLGFAQK